MAKNHKTLTQTERRRLEHELDQTVAEIDRLREYLKAEPDVTSDDVDLEVYEREKNLALVRRLELKIEEIEKALKSAEKGAYGICEHCGKPIDPERLKVLPETTLCVKCKNELERTVRRIAR
ncbi:MAG: TraR/DksA C4-type zinc finger protein [Chloroflexi bacterium]|nr:TraR/DksA C4-type zinc finger protein [Chloroflexota bacterium]